MAHPTNEGKSDIVSVHTITNSGVVKLECFVEEKVEPFRWVRYDYSPGRPRCSRIIIDTRARLLGFRERIIYIVPECSVFNSLDCEIQGTKSCL